MSLSRRCSSIIIIALALAVAAGAPLSPSAHGASWSGQADRMPSVEELGRGVLAALREGSFDALVPHLASAEDFGEMVASTVEIGQMTEEQAQQFIPRIPGLVEALLVAAREDFERIQEKGIDQSVSWDQAEVTDYRIIIITTEERTVDAATLDAEQPIGAWIYMRFAAGGTVHELNLGDCARTSRGWIITRGFSWPQASIGAQMSVPTSADDRSPTEAVETTTASNVSAVPGGTEPVTIAGGRTLAAIFSEDLDENLREHLAVSRRNAVDWQTDARLHEVRLNVGDGGQVTWRFHWLSDSSDHSVQFFTSSPSLKVVIENDPEASARPTLGIEETVGFNALGEILAANGVDLSSIDTEAVINLELSVQDWRSPPGYYYYLFLTTGDQHYVVAATGEFQQ